MATDCLPDGNVDEAIAVVGMACRFPGDASSVDAFWEMIRDGKDAWSEIPEERFNAKGWYHPDPNRPGSFHIKGAHFIKGDIAAFDAPFFSISTAEAVSMDPQQRMLLEVTYEALDSAGIPAATLSNSATSVFCGSFVRDYEQPCMRDPDTTPPYSATGNGIAILANRVSHAFDFAGTSQTIDTGCSASMIAVHQACKSLLSGESDVGIAAGVGLIFSPNTLVPMANLNILGADGRCYTFDERASGYGRGEGTGVVVLKRLRDAVAANDTIRAVIRATASNQDGHTQGITLPSKERQVRNMTEVYTRTGLDVRRTAYMECHGTGTKVGDVKETQAVAEVFCGHRTAANPLVIGSVKTNIGHLEGSAGVAGLIKGILVVERGLIPKHLNFRKANPSIDFAAQRLALAHELMPWPVAGLRRASVNSFGFGGTNAHVVVDDAAHFLAEARIAGGQHNAHVVPGDRLCLDDLYSFQGPRNHLYVFSGHDEAGLGRVVDVQAAFVAKKAAATEPVPAAAAFEASYSYTLLHRRSRLHWRSFVVASSAADLLAKLEAGALSTPVRAAVHASVPADAAHAPRVALVFCGQGAQWFGMGRELCVYQAFYASLTSASWYLTQALGAPFSLWDELHKSAADSAVDEPQIAQPATTAVQVALVDLLRASGVRPEAVVGHSSGEIAAAYAAGAIGREDAWRIAFARGQCVARLAEVAPGLQGAMLAVAVSEDEARRGIEDAGVQGAVDVACINGPSAVTLSGDAAAVAVLHDFFRDQSRRAARVNVATAYHSAHMKAIEGMYLEALHGLPKSRSTLTSTFYSSVYGHAVPTSVLDAQYWVRNLVCPVDFFSAVSALVRETRPDVFVEVSPHRVWPSALHAIHAEVAPDAAQPGYVAPLVRHADASATFLASLGQLWAAGVDVSLAWSLTNACGKKPRHLVDVPSYPWDHTKRYWHESHLSRTNRFRAHGREDLIGAPLENATPQDPRWRGFFRVHENPWLEDHVIQKSVMYPAGGMLAMAVEAAKQLSGHVGGTVLGYEVSAFTILKPMLIPATAHGLEHMLSARLVDDADTADAPVYEFMILSKPLDGAWTTHAKGRLTTVYADADTDADTALATRLGATERRAACCATRDAAHTQSDPRQFYETLGVVGMAYGPTFRNLVEIRRADAAAHTVVQIPDTKSRMPFAYEFDHVIHPATLDAMVQSVFALADDGAAMLPCAAARVFVAARLPQGAGRRFQGHTTATTTANGAVAEICMFDDALHAPAVVIEGLALKSVASSSSGPLTDSNDQFLPAHRNLCSEVVWRVDADSLAPLGRAPPSSTIALVDMLAHKDPALRIVYHIPAQAVAPVDADDAAHQLDIVAETLKLTNVVFDNLTVGHGTPRFAQCALSGVYAEQVWQHLRVIKGTHPAFERVTLADGGAKSTGCGLAFCSVAAGMGIDALAGAIDALADGGWLVLTSRLRGFIARAQCAALRGALQAAGFAVDALPAKSCAFFAAQKRGRTASLSAACSVVSRASTSSSGTPLATPTSSQDDSERVVFLVADAGDKAGDKTGSLGTMLAKAARLALEAQLPVSVDVVSVADVVRGTASTTGALVVSLAEVDTDLLRGMDETAFEGMHRLLMQSRGVLWVTQGALGDCASPARAAFHGLARTLRSEGGKTTRIATLDIDAAVVDADSVLSAAVVHVFQTCLFAAGPPAGDVDYYFANGALHIPRLMTLPFLNHAIEQGRTGAHMRGQAALVSKSSAMQLDTASLGAPDGAVFEETDALRRPLGEGEVRMSVESTTLLSPAATDVVGQVLEVGTGVGLVPGSKVVARIRGTLATHVIVDAGRVRVVTSTAGHRCPTALATAVYALQTSRAVGSDDVVLVLAPLSAYGQMAVRVARVLGARVLAVCPRADVSQVAGLGVPRSDILVEVADRDRLVQQVRARVPDGADVVLDATSLDMDLAFAGVAECGRVVRVARAPAQPVTVPARNASLETVDLELLASRRPATARRLDADVAALLAVHPDLDCLGPVHEHNMRDAGVAVDAAAQSPREAHVVYTVPNVNAGANVVTTRVALTRPAQLAAYATYVLVGGLGGLGRCLAEHLVQRGARHLAFVSRSGGESPAARALLDKLRGQGVQAMVFAADVGDAASLAGVLQAMQAAMPPVRGAIQCAAVVDDVAFGGMTFGAWQRAFRPKTEGALNLHRQLPADLDFLVLLSSASGVIGNRGQANYAAGNAVQDALARHRSARGMHTVSLDLGLVFGAGMVAENAALLDAMQASGFIGIRLCDVLFLVDQAMQRGGGALQLPAQVVTTVGTGGLTLQNQPSDPFWTRTALFRFLNQVDAPPHGLDGAGGGAGRDLRSLVHDAPDLAAAAGLVSTALVATVARRKGMAAADLDPDQPLAAYGIDSLDSMFVLGWVARETGVTVQSVDRVTIADLARDIARRAREAAALEF